MDYKETLCLPKTDFPMKAQLASREPQFLKRWEEIDLYGKILAQSADRPRYLLHDGPPYANGNIHMGHALNKILKDIVIKARTMMGYHSVYRPGWDCHGLPIEHQVELKLGDKKAGLSKAEIRKYCREYAEEFLGIQREEFERLGVFGLWQDPYLTINYKYEGTIARELGKFMERGSLYKAKKPVYWCAHCRTALADAEVEYHDQVTPAIFVRFKLTSDIGQVVPALSGRNDAHMVIWTTTPWTIPANLAIAVHPDMEYSAVETPQHGVLIVATELVKDVMQACAIENYTELAVVKGAALERQVAQHPLYERDSLVILADFVTVDSGSGCVHIAPGHGEDDYLVGKAYGLEAFAPVDNDGCYTNEVPELKGKFVFDANDDVNAWLKEKGALLSVSKYAHSYPYCWRCKSPIIFRSTPQWFISMEHDGLRKQALNEINRVEWIPSWGRERIYNMVVNRPDWCISRQRAWGVPIPIFYCKDCGHTVADKAVAEHVAAIFDNESADAWFIRPASELLPEGFACPSCGHAHFDKEEDIVDVWFDSGVSYAAVCELDERLGMPVDLYLEGSDQHRGWFQSTLLASVGTRGQAPYKTVLTHGFVVDGEGKKMSKSQGNTVAPQQIIEKYGAEILRLWVSAQDYTSDIRISNEIIERLTETYRRIRNTARFMLGNLSDFDPSKDAVAYVDMLDLDRYALHVTQDLTAKVREAYLQVEPYAIYQLVHNFCVVDMSSFYLDILKDRLYVYRADSLERRSAQTALFEITLVLTKLLAPILAFTADEIWTFIPAFAGKEESVHLSAMAEVRPEYRDDNLAERWRRIMALKQEAAKVMEEARRDKVIGHPLDAEVTFRASGETLDFLHSVEAELKPSLIVSKVSVTAGEGPYLDSPEFKELAVEVAKAPGEKCPRCWNYSVAVAAGQAVCERCAAQI